MQGAPAGRNFYKNQKFALVVVALSLILAKPATSKMCPLEHQKAQVGADGHARQSF